MVMRSISFTDGRGRSHTTAESATVSDLAALFAEERTTPAGVAENFAALIMKNRKEIERIFKEHDEATGGRE